MENINFLIKPISSLCNLNCTYCFYKDESRNREVEDFGKMSFDTAKNIIDKAFSISNNVSFTFQGGEPTLIGVDFFKSFIDYVNLKKGNKNVYYSIQTNGVDLNEEYISLFKENNFLVGVSLDGVKMLHEKNRGTDTFLKVTHLINLLIENKICFSVLSVVTNDSLKYIDETYNLFKDLGIKVMQFIPCLDTILGSSFLSKENFENFLNNLFKLWIKDVYSSSPVSIRYFENLALISLGEYPEMCGLFGHCENQLVVESNGNVYPCDFYCLDKYLLGNINADSLEKIIYSGISFTKRTSIDDLCKSCKYLKYCMGGCVRENKKYCESYKNFLEKNIDEILKLRDFLSR